MLSRIALRSGQMSRVCIINARHTGTTTTAVSSPAQTDIMPSKSERDEVNFPHMKRTIHPGKVRMAIIPEEYFQFLYPKTGVTGPYLLGIGLLNYLFSKEIFVVEHEFSVGIILAGMIYMVVKKFGPAITKSLDDQCESELKYHNDSRDGTINDMKESIDNEKDCQWRIAGQHHLFEAKRQNIGLQLEAVYRERLSTVYEQVKQKLDYQLETSNVKTRLEQKHMVNWIVDNVRKSITQTQEDAALKQCFSDLKGLAAKA